LFRDMNLMFWEIKKTFENWAKAIEKNCNINVENSRSD